MKKIAIYAFMIIAIFSYTNEKAFAFSGGLLDGLPGWLSYDKKYTYATTDDNNSTGAVIRYGGSHYIEYTLPGVAEIRRIAWNGTATANWNVRVYAYTSSGTLIANVHLGTVRNGNMDVNWKNVKRVRVRNHTSNFPMTLFEFNVWGEYQPTAPPENLTASVSGGNVTLEWMPVDGALGYFVYMNGVKLNDEPITSTHYTTTAPQNTWNTWHVTSWNGNFESEESNTVKTYFDSIPPSVPKGLTAKAQNSRVVLNWKKNTESDFAGYYVYRDGEKITTEPITSTSYTDTEVMNGVTYEYQVSAVDLYGNESGMSAPVSITPDIYPPETPAGVGTNPGNEIVQIYWKPVDDPDLAGYYVYRDGEKITTEPITGTSYTDTGLENFREYEYQVSSVNIYDMESAPSAPVIGMPEDPDVTPPDPPTGVQATTGDREIRITWNPNPEDDLKGYFVYRDGKRINKEPITETTFIDTGLKNGREYTYTIRAVDFAGNISDPSEPVTETPEPPASAPPENVRARAGNSMVTVTWKEKKGANLYAIYRDGEMIGTVTGTEFIDDTVENGQRYRYQVSAFVNGIESEMSYPVMARPGDFVDFGSSDGQFSLSDVVLSAWNFLRRFNPFMILIFSLLLVPTLIDVIIWLWRKSHTRQDSALESKDNERRESEQTAEREPREEIRETEIRERARDRERIERIREREREQIAGHVRRPEKAILSATIRGNRKVRGTRYAGREVREPREMRPGRRRRDERY